jgi:hypothetical protein
MVAAKTSNINAAVRIVSSCDPDAGDVWNEKYAISATATTLHPIKLMSINFFIKFADIPISNFYAGFLRQPNLLAY